MTDRLLGALELMILKALSREPLHGWGILNLIERNSEEVFTVSQGALHPALQRLERRGWIDSFWGTTGERRKARYYRLSEAGRKGLAQEEVLWARRSEAVNRVLGSMDEQK